MHIELGEREREKYSSNDFIDSYKMCSHHFSGGSVHTCSALSDLPAMEAVRNCTTMALCNLLKRKDCHVVQLFHCSLQDGNN